MAFVVFEKGSSPVPTVPSVTIQKRGLISLNRAAMDLLRGDANSDPVGVELMWDADNRVIGLRSAPLTAHNAYPVRAQGQKDRGPFLIAGTLFTKFIGLNTVEARRWTPSLDGDILCVDLHSESTKVASRRGASKKAEDGAEASPPDIPPDGSEYDQPGGTG